MFGAIGYPLKKPNIWKHTQSFVYMINLRFNYPISAGQYNLVQQSLNNLPVNAELLELEPPNGYLQDKEIAAQWLSKPDHSVLPADVLMACGGHHAVTVISIATGLAHQTVIVDAYTYNGFISIASLLKIKLVACPMDADGMLPQQLEQLIATHNAKAIYLTPTIHNPLAFTMPLQRRLQIVEVARKADILIIDDDAYGFLDAEAPLSFAHLAPERAFYIYSFAKPFAPGIKLSYIITPPQWRDAVSGTIRVSSSGPISIMIKLVNEWINSGDMQKAIDYKRQQAVQKQAIVREYLQGTGYVTQPLAFHLWLPLPAGVSSSAFSGELLNKGVDVVPGAAYKTGNIDMPDGIRIAFGSASEDELKTGLRIIGELLNS